jgi:hypothetical protein
MGHLEIYQVWRTTTVQTLGLIFQTTLPTINTGEAIRIGVQSYYGHYYGIDIYDGTHYRIINDAISAITGSYSAEDIFTLYFDGTTFHWQIGTTKITAADTVYAYPTKTIKFYSLGLTGPTTADYVFTNVKLYLTGATGEPNTWSSYPALTNVDLNNYNLQFQSRQYIYSGVPGNSTGVPIPLITLYGAPFAYDASFSQSYGSGYGNIMISPQNGLYMIPDIVSSAPQSAIAGTFSHGIFPYSLANVPIYAPSGHGAITQIDDGQQFGFVQSDASQTVFRFTFSFSMTADAQSIFGIYLDSNQMRGRGGEEDTFKSTTPYQVILFGVDGGASYLATGSITDTGTLSRLQ